MITIYINKELPEEVINCIRDTDEEQFGFHTNNHNVDSILEQLKTGCLSGTVAVLYGHNCIGFLTDANPGIVTLDSLRSNKASIFDYISFLKDVVKELSKTNINKIETRALNKDLCKLQKKTGFVLEGTLRKNWLMPDGTYIDTYAFGYLLKENK